ncbi:hypothetical protein SAMN05660206_101487 [Sphingobacterium wenxiniae]|uniref:Uncharacterized protein n=1 Tax=Sphingobacterium wenxiniae TaxID=683125 RepID=A0A1I6PIB2_9SPHI|nr:hypothetical protein SAMN05660206_101487 [Sphingobacterium wenxiniae]
MGRLILLHQPDGKKIIINTDEVLEINESIKSDGRSSTLILKKRLLHVCETLDEIIEAQG